MRQPEVGDKVWNNLVLIMNDYFRCVKNNGSLKSKRKFLYQILPVRLSHLQSNRSLRMASFG